MLCEHDLNDDEPACSDDDHSKLTRVIRFESDLPAKPSRELP